MEKMGDWPWTQMQERVGFLSTLPQRDYLSRGVTVYNNTVLYVHKKKIALTVFWLEEKQICIYVF